MAIRPKAGGFPYLAKVLRQAGVKRYDVDFTHEHADTMGVMTKNMSREYSAVDVK
jgi:hypothetical protein